MAKCLPFVYGGCRGNNNRFLTLEECSEMCAQATGTIDEGTYFIVTRSFTEGGYLV
jgi:hypothetical protein